MVNLYGYSMEGKKITNYSQRDKYIQFLVKGNGELLFPKTLQMKAAMYVDSIIFGYENGEKTGPDFDECGKSDVYSLMEGEYIIHVRVCYYGCAIFEIDFFTTENRKLMMNTNAPYICYPKEVVWKEYRVPDGYAIVGIDATNTRSGGINGLNELMVYYGSYKKEEMRPQRSFSKEDHSVFQFYTIHQTSQKGMSPDLVISSVLKIDIENDAQFCVALSIGEDDAYYPNGVSVKVFDRAAHQFQKCTEERRYVIADNVGIYQFSCFEPGNGTYTVVVNSDNSAKFFLELQVIDDVFTKDQTLEQYADINFRNKDAIYPLIGRPKYKMSAVMEEPLLKTIPNENALPFYMPKWLCTIYGFAVSNPIAATIIAIATVAVTTIIIYEIKKSTEQKPSPAPTPAPIAKMEAKYPNRTWAVISEEDACNIKKLEDLQSQQYHGAVSAKMLKFFKYIYLERMDHNIDIASMNKDNWITCEDLKACEIERLKVDLGGEGCYWEKQVPYSGFHDALNINSRSLNGIYNDDPIPMLLYAGDWTKIVIPIHDNLVSRFMIQGITGRLTDQEINEIVRCLNKERGRIDAWYTVAAKEGMIIDMTKLANKLHTRLINNPPEPDYVYHKIMYAGMEKVSIILG